jgi:glycosyltransferase involved in cell wall biosynthesis
MRSGGCPSPCYAVIIPAFEPDARLSTIVRAVTAALPRVVVVVDDGSSATSAIHFQELQGLERVVVLRHRSNRGKGEAIKTGLRHVLKHCPDGVGVVTMDADGQHTLEDFLKVRALLLREKQALVLGERAFSGKVPALSRVGNVLTKVIFNCATGMHLSDTQTGLRGIPLGLAPALLQIGSSRYEFELDTLFLCRERGVSIIGVEIRTVYIDDNRSSHFRPVRDSARIYAHLLGHLARLLRKMIWRHDPAGAFSAHPSGARGRPRQGYYPDPLR